MLNLFFGFQGRIGRGSWWLAQLVAIPVVYILGFSAVAGLGLSIPENGEPDAMTGGGVLLAILVAVAIAIWINVASSVKRYHDRGKSGMWFFIVFVPFIGGLWQLIECGFCSGDDGENNYGPPAGSISSDDVSGHISSGSATAGASGKLAKLDDDYFRNYAAQQANKAAEPVVQSGYARPAYNSGGSAGAPVFGRR